ncbi:MAG: hypothetical protein MI723_05240 [Caulobacterales bacterium]|nr:hypothetical protein [Caulobacterales bacterium]
MTAAKRQAWGVDEFLKPGGAAAGDTYAAFPGRRLKELDESGRVRPQRSRTSRDQPRTSGDG